MKPNHPRLLGHGRRSRSTAVCKALVISTSRETVNEKALLILSFRTIVINTNANTSSHTLLLISFFFPLHDGSMQHEFNSVTSHNPGIDVSSWPHHVRSLRKIYYLFWIYVDCYAKYLDKVFV